LRKQGLAYKEYRDVVSQGLLEGTPLRPVEHLGALPQPEPVAPQAASLQATIQALQEVVVSMAARSRSDSYGDGRLKRKPWTRKEALGHLIDWAIAHQQWLTRAVIESRLAAAGYPDEAAVAIQHYAEHSWTDTVDLWVLLNQLLIHVLLRVPEDKANLPCRIGIAAPVPLAKLMEAYVEHCQDIVGQMLARLE
jgi:hypothetical protein